MTRNNHGQAELQLLRAARQGCHDAQAELLKGQQDTIYRFCLAQLGHSNTAREAAREATQETAVRMLVGLPHFRGDSQLSTWALGIALNVCREQRRKEGFHDGHATLDDIASAREIPPDQALADQDLANQVNQRLQQLPSRQREALVLRYFEDLTIEETAKAMGISTGTVKATVFQALRNLRRWGSE